MKNSKDKLEFFKDRKKAMRNMGAAAIKMESASWISLKFCFVFKIQVTPSFPQGDTWSLPRLFYGLTWPSSHCD